MKLKRIINRLLNRKKKHHCQTLPPSRKLFMLLSWNQNMKWQSSMWQYTCIFIRAPVGQLFNLRWCPRSVWYKSVVSDFPCYSGFEPISLWIAWMSFFPFFWVFLVSVWQLVYIAGGQSHLHGRFCRIPFSIPKGCLVVYLENYDI